MQVNYQLGEWDKRKAALLPLLDAAAGEGLVERAQLGRLSEFLLGRGVTVGVITPIPGPADPMGTSLDQPIASEPVPSVEESEAPRFIRGFHDILITIGIIVVLAGLAGLATIYAVIPASLVLAEILVRRQRLALPAVVLTIALSISGGMAMNNLLKGLDGITGSWVPLIVALAGLAGLQLLFFWRYKVPIALAGGFTTAYACLVLALARLWTAYRHDDALQSHAPLLLTAFLGLYALLVFGTALRYDMADRMRVTRRSDVAFWMHLAAAPAILYAILGFVFIDSGHSWLSAQATLSQALAIVAAVVILMLIGIVLDRRAFVTSGLISFGYAFKVLLTEGGFAQLIASTHTLGFIILFAVGVVVLGLGIGWQVLRRQIVLRLPDAVQRRVPPVRA